MTRRGGWIALLALACACGPRTGSGGDEFTRDRRRISPEELATQTTGTVYEAIERLRPIWLRSRSTTLATQAFPRVRVDGQDYGPVESLARIDVAVVSEIRFISARDATTRYGTGYPGGAILVILKRRP